MGLLTVRGFGLALLLLLAGATIATLFYPQVTSVSVEGNKHHSRAAVLELANIGNGTPFLWVTRRSVRALAKDPWILNATIIKEWPHHVSVLVREREPALGTQAGAVAIDGTLLPGASETQLSELPRLEGWGEPRTAEALALLQLLRPYGVQVISYSPEGFEILLNQSELFTPGIDALREHWSAFKSQSGGRIAVYPWGVSKSNE